MNIIVSGANGHMGKILRDTIAESQDLKVVGLRDLEDGVMVNPNPSGADIVIDFSNAAGTEELLDYCLSNKLPLVLCTTGQNQEQQDLIKEASKEIPIFYSGNMSLGIAVTADLVARAASAFPGADIEIVETHHRRKVDAPSGTALLLAEAIKEVRPELNVVCGRSGMAKRETGDLGISSVRMGNVVGIHQVIISTDTQSITITHEAHNRGLFADGALSAARYLADKPAGLYNMKNLVE